MPQFAYRAKKGPHDVVDGTIEAPSLDEAVERLDEIGLLPINLEEVKGGAPGAAADGKPGPSAPAAARVPHGIRLFSRIRSSDVTVFTRQLATLIKAGVPILKALWIISEQAPNPKFRALLDRAQADIREGKPLSEFLAGHPRQFPPIYVAMVRAGEDSGTLQEALTRVANYRRRQEEIASRVRAAMAYPALMALTGVGTIAFMLTFVIPRLTGLFASLGTSLPLPTRALMRVSALFADARFWWALTAFAFVAVFAGRMKSAELKLLWSRVSLRAPALRMFVIKSELARFARTLELLIKSGIPILRALEVTTPVLGNEVLRRRFRDAHGELAGGGSFGDSLRAAGTFPLFVSNLVSVGEESGKLDEALAEIADFYERETEEAIKMMTSLVEPLMILVMGAVVGFIVIAMLLPMFELNLAVR